MMDSVRAAALGWDELPSGSAITLGGGLTGYVAQIAGEPWWWVSREGGTVAEGSAADEASARKAVFGALWDLAAKLR